MVSAGVKEVHVDRDLSGMGYVLRNPVQDFYYFTRSHAVDWRVVAEVTRILVLWTGPCRSYAMDQPITYPIDRIALRNKRSPTVEQNRPAMRRVGTIVRGISRDPIRATQRGRHNNRRALLNG